MLERREVVLGGLLTLLVIPTDGHTNCCGELDEFQGCAVRAEAVDELVASSSSKSGVWFGELGEIKLSSGDKFLDRAMLNSLVDMSERFGVLPGFAYVQEAKGGNAWASSSKALGRSDGSILFGLKLISRYRRSAERPDAAIVSTLAHEFGHIISNRQGLKRRLLKGQSTVRRNELHADLLSGYYAGVRKLEDPNFPAAHVALDTYESGDFSFGSKSHHGTPEERGRAAVEGFKLAYEQRLPLQEAIERGVSIVQTM